MLLTNFIRINWILITKLYLNSLNLYYQNFILINFILVITKFYSNQLNLYYRIVFEFIKCLLPKYYSNCNEFIGFYPVSKLAGCKSWKCRGICWKVDWASWDLCVSTKVPFPGSWIRHRSSGIPFWWHQSLLFRPIYAIKFNDFIHPRWFHYKRFIYIGVFLNGYFAVEGFGTEEILYLSIVDFQVTGLYRKGPRGIFLNVEKKYQSSIINSSNFNLKITFFLPNMCLTARGTSPKSASFIAYNNPGPNTV